MAAALRIMKYVNLGEKMKNLLTKIVAISKAAVLEKDGKIETSKASYAIRTEEGILGHFRPLLRSMNLHMWVEDISTVFVSASSIKIIVKCKIMDLDSGESLTFCGVGTGMDRADKDSGKAFTYAFRNAIQKLFLLVSGEDSDSISSDQIIEDLKDEAIVILNQLRDVGYFKTPGSTEASQAEAYNQKLLGIKGLPNGASVDRTISAMRDKLAELSTGQ